MPVRDDYQDLHAKAQQAYRAGDSDSAVERYAQLVSRLMELGAEAIGRQPDVQDLLSDAAQALTDILRWEGRYEEAIGLQERLLSFFPGRALALRTLAANLRIEGGHEEKGLQELREIAESDPDNIWGWIALGTGYMWTERYEETEQQLLRAAKMETAEEADRALAYKYLFDMYGIQKRIHQAVDTWEEACQLDPELRATLPELYTMLIHWRHYSSAEDYLKLDRSRLRRLFYTGLLSFSNNLMPQAAEAWNKVSEHDPDELTEGYDEYAEACVRLLLPSRALQLLEPLIERREVSYWRLIIAGLAYAQRRIINRAKGTLDVALRMADLERPRRTRPAGKRRILDARARILYAQVRIDKDVRQELDRYFIP